MILLESCGVSNGPPSPGDLILDCRLMPDPSPIVHDLPGTRPEVAHVIVSANPLVQPMLALATELIRRMAAERMDVHVVFVCNAGWHRSVFAAEYVRAQLSDLEVHVQHRDLRED